MSTCQIINMSNIEQTPSHYISVKRPSVDLGVKVTSSLYIGSIFLIGDMSYALYWTDIGQILDKHQASYISLTRLPGRLVLVYKLLAYCI